MKSVPEMVEPVRRQDSKALEKTIEDDDVIAEAGMGNDDEAIADRRVVMDDSPAALVGHGSRQHRR
jgi:hypothetical protein